MYEFSAISDDDFIKASVSGDVSVERSCGLRGDLEFINFSGISDSEVLTATQLIESNVCMYEFSISDDDFIKASVSGDVPVELPG